MTPIKVQHQKAVCGYAIKQVAAISLYHSIRHIRRNGRGNLKVAKCMPDSDRAVTAFSADVWHRHIESDGALE